MEFHYSEPRLGMTVVGRLLVRIVTYFSNSFFLAAAVILLFSEIPSLRAVGLLLILFFADRALHFGLGDLPLNKNPLPNVNISYYVTPETYRVIEIAFDRALVTKTDFVINLSSELLHKAEVERAIKHLSINLEEFTAKIEKSGKKTLAPSPSKEEIINQVKKLMSAAFEQARQYQEPAITPIYLLAALARLEHQKLTELLAMFGSAKDDLRYAAALGRLYRPKSSLEFNDPLLKIIEIARNIEKARQIQIPLAAIKTAVAASDSKEALENMIQLK